MAIAAVAARNSAVASTSGTTLAQNPSATIAAGRILLTFITTRENVAVTSVTDAVGNTWEFLGRYSNATEDNAHVECWMCRVVYPLASTSAITVTFASAVTDRCMATREFSVAAGKTIAQSAEAAVVGNEVDAANGFGSASFASLSSRQRLYMRVLAKQANSATGITATSGFTSWATTIRSRNNALAIIARSEYRINTSTGETSNPTLAVAGNTAGLFFALEEVDASPVITGVDPTRTDPGTTSAVTITGLAFRAGATVTLWRSGVQVGTATDVVVVGDGEITCTFPALSAGPVDVVVENTDTTDSGSSGAAAFEYDYPPSYGTITPSVGALATGTTSLDVAIPAGSNGDKLLLCVGNKFPTAGPSAPAGWTLVAQGQGGAGTNGSDSGQTYATIYERTADGTEGASVAVTLTGASLSVGRVVRLAKDLGDWELGSTTGGDNTPGLQVAADGASDPGIEEGDLVVVTFVPNTDVPSSYSAHAVSAPGVTSWGASTAHDGANISDPFMGLSVSLHPVLGGASTGIPSFTATSANQGGSAPCGGVVFVRARAASGGGDTGIVGSVAVTLDDFTLNAAGTSSITGTITATLDDFTLTAVGDAEEEQDPITGEVAATLDDFTLDAAGTSQIEGEVAVTLDDFGLAATGTSQIEGEVAATLDDFTLAATGTTEATGELEVTLDDFTLDAVGTPAVTGTVAATLGDFTLDAAGTPRIEGEVTFALDDFTLDASGASQIAGTVAVALDDFTLDAAGTSDNTNLGTVAATLDDFTLDASGTSSITGTTAATLDDFGLAAQGTPRIIASVGAGLDDFTLDVAGTPVVTGEVTATLDDFTLDVVGDAADTIVGSVVATIDDFILAATGTPAIEGEVAATLEDFALDAAGATPITGTITATLDDFTLAALGQFGRFEPVVTRVPAAGVTAYTQVAAAKITHAHTVKSSGVTRTTRGVS